MTPARALGRDARPALASSALFFTVLLSLVALDELPVLILAAYGVLSVIAFLMYRADKSAAIEGRRRTPESTLHAVDLLGGWPGALIARRIFRHKTVKQPFVTIFWLTVLANIAALVWLVGQAPAPLP